MEYLVDAGNPENLVTLDNLVNPEYPVNMQSLTFPENLINLENPVFKKGSSIRTISMPRMTNNANFYLGLILH